MIWLDSITGSMGMNLMSKFWETVKDKEVWHAAVHGVTKSWIWLSDWTTTACHLKKLFEFHKKLTKYLEPTLFPFSRWEQDTDC